MDHPVDAEQAGDELLEQLAGDAEALCPRLFAIYGVLREIEGVVDELPYVGWGMDLGDGCGALYWDAPERSTHFSDSAEQVLRFYERLGAARLLWLDSA